MKVQGYHGTTRSFQRFNRSAPSATASPTRHLGLFFSACPRIAAHFTLRPALLNDAYADAGGSHQLRDDPWAFDADPFLPGAQVIQAELDFQHPYPMSARAFATWVATVHAQGNRAPATVAAFRQHLEDAGHDGLVITAWEPGTGEGPELCVEFAAPTYVAFWPEQVGALTRRPAETAWDQ